ncbi:hypothetical protein F4818DRAFT_436511 [Hypoxylon cercidicola]|nr:hypothetical protein F4818DRAFT_436511 [Hypoxylon cercidicola]
MTLKLMVESQNEPMSPDTSVCKNNDPRGWLCADNPVRIATGRIGGDISHDCTSAKAATQCAEVDLIAVHLYGGSQASSPSQWSDGAKQWVEQAGGKLVFVEWGVNTGSSEPKTELPAQTGDLNKAAMPDLYRQFLPRQNGGCSYNPFGIFVEGASDADAIQN